VLIPGQPEAEREAQQRRSGIVLDRGHHGLLVTLGERLGLEFPAVTPAADLVASGDAD
jgi:hypothetical protein